MHQNVVVLLRAVVNSTITSCLPIVHHVKFTCCTHQTFGFHNGHVIAAVFTMRFNISCEFHKPCASAICGSAHQQTHVCVFVQCASARARVQCVACVTVVCVCVTHVDHIDMSANRQCEESGLAALFHLVSPACSPKHHDFRQQATPRCVQLLYSN